MPKERVQVHNTSVEYKRKSKCIININITSRKDVKECWNRRSRSRSDEGGEKKSP
jgi:hypothetical protein